MTKVLVVEDERNIAELLAAVLTGEGYQVLVAMNGREGLDLLAREPPQLVLCDHMMPVMDGATMLEAMAADPSLRSIPVVMMSAMREAAVAKCYSGYAAFLHKPFKLLELLDVVKRTLGTGNVEAS
ncbi:MAG TPA: response regulator [Acetobacteraceae bacterium]